MSGRLPPIPSNHRPNLRNIPAEIRDLPYFYPNFPDSNVATKFVKQYATGPGSFVVRLSSKGDNYLSLSVSIENNSVRHVNVLMEKERRHVRYYIVPEVKFNSFQELCEYYTRHRICNLEQIDNVRLLYPINITEVRERAHSSADYERLQNVPERPSAQGIPVPQREESRIGYAGQMGVPPTPKSETLNVLPFGSPADEGKFNFSESQGQRKRNSLDSQGNENRSSGGSVEDVPTASALGHSRGSEENVLNDDSRPPAPLPSCPSMASDVYYTHPRDENLNRIEELRTVLKETEMCDCGIPLSDSELPRGWTLHLSHDAMTLGSLFYQSSKGETTWHLPENIIPEITDRQRRKIIKICAKTGKAPPAALFPSQFPVQHFMTGNVQGVREALNTVNRARDYGGRSARDYGHVNPAMGDES